MHHEMKTAYAAREIAEAAARNAEAREAGLVSENKKLNRARQQAGGAPRDRRRPRPSVRAVRGS